MLSPKKSSEVLKHAPGIAAGLSCFNNLAAKLLQGLTTKKVKMNTLEDYLGLMGIHETLTSSPASALLFIPFRISCSQCNY